MLRGTLTELRGAIVTGADAGLVVKSWPLAWKVTVPV
jgi:heme A synthase